MPRIVLVHGTATTGAVWDPVRNLLADLDTVAPNRPSSGKLETELDWLAALATDAVVVGMSGGATLCLALAASDVPAVAIIAHEPAVGSLLPTLLDPVAEAFACGGAAGLGAALYGPTWAPSMMSDAEAVERDLAMFRAFEPAMPRAAPTLVTTGSDSPAARHLASTRLSEVFGYNTATLASGHFVAQDRPAAIATLIRAVATAVPAGASVGR
jgi:pimeloyl-ACP methyl ester carboxylesterase